MRFNTTSWIDCNTLTKKCCELLTELMQYQAHTWPLETQGQGHFGGDQGVLVRAIELRKALDKVIKKSPN